MAQYNYGLVYGRVEPHSQATWYGEKWPGNEARKSVAEYDRAMT